MLVHTQIDRLSLSRTPLLCHFCHAINLHPSLSFLAVSLSLSIHSQWLLTPVCSDKSSLCNRVTLIYLQRVYLTVHFLLIHLSLRVSLLPLCPTVQQTEPKTRRMKLPLLFVLLSERSGTEWTFIRVITNISNEQQLFVHFFSLFEKRNTLKPKPDHSI